MTTEQFITLVNDIGQRLNIEPIFTHDGEVAHLGDDEFELHKSGIFRHVRYLYPHPNAERIANAMRLEAADRRGPGIRKRAS